MFRPLDVDVDELLSSSHGVGSRVDIWRGADYLGSPPLLDGSSLTESADQLVGMTLDLDIPAVDKGGTRWQPSGPLDPLNVYGQRAHVSYGIGRVDGSTLWCPLGWFILDDWTADGRTVSVSALDVRDALRTAEFTTPVAPAVGGTFVSELRRLVGGRLPIDFTNAPTDRAVPSSLAWQDSRIDAIDELLTAWPARADLDSTGSLVIVDPTPPTAADVQLVAGGGTVIGTARSGSRDSLRNVVVATGADSGDTTAPPVYGVARITDPASPLFVDGPAGELVERFGSPLLKTDAQCAKAAATILAKRRRQSAVIPVQALPDPRIGVHTRVDLVVDGETLPTVVQAVNLPLTAEGGPMTLTLGMIADA